MINIWAMVLSFVLYYGLGMLWYSPVLFGNQWQKLVEKKNNELQMKPTYYMLSIFSALLAVVFMAFIFEIGLNYSIITAVFIGLLMAGVIFATGFTQVIFEGKPFTLYLIDFGYHAIGLLITCIVLGVWN